jgi:glycosyltransferase involved in cell wall biosynthesis
MGPVDYIGAVNIYRITLPLTYLNQETNIRAGWTTVDIVSTELREGLPDRLFNNDIIILHRLLTDMPKQAAGLCKALRMKGARLVYEADDDYSGRYRPADEIPGLTWKPYITEVDAVTVSTKPLAELAKEESGGKPVYVVPNSIEYDFFTRASLSAEREFDELTIGVAGTRTHYDDWKVIAEVIPKILEKHPNVRFLVGGHAPDYLEDMGTLLPPVLYPDYPAMLRQIDILCCAVDPCDKFNDSKSAIKAIEGWSASRQVGKTRYGGCAIIASKAKPYIGTVNNRNNGLLVEHTAGAWTRAIEKLIQDRVLRQKLQVRGLKSAKTHSIAGRWKAWADAYREIAGGSYRV